MNKKPAQLSESLLANRPRKGVAKPQTELQATSTPPTEIKASKPIGEIASPHNTPRRRGRRSENTIQLNMKIRPDVADKFTNLADRENLIFCDLLAKLVDFYEKNK